MSNISIGIRKTVIAGLVALFAVAQADATLLVWYKFNEGSGTTTANSGAAGAAGNLTFFGSTAFSASGFSPDPSGYSMNNSPGSTMGGTGGGAWTAGSLDALDNLTAMTVTGWYRSDGSFAGLARLVNRADNTIGAGMWAIYTDGTSGRLQANIGGATTVNTSGNYWQANKWIFFAVTYQGGGSPSVNFFIGDETTPVTALTSSTSGTLPANLGDGSNVLVVGNRSQTQNRAFKGWIDDVRIYDEVLSASALESVRIAGIPEPGTAGLLLFSAGLMAVRRIRRGRE